MNGQLTKSCHSSGRTLGLLDKRQDQKASVLCLDPLLKSTRGHEPVPCSLWRKADKRWLLEVLPVFGACHLLSTTLSEQLRVVLDPRGYMGILSPTDRDVGELINWGKALADFWSEGKVGRLKPVALHPRDFVGDHGFDLPQSQGAGKSCVMHF